MHLNRLPLLVQEMAIRVVLHMLALNGIEGWSLAWHASLLMERVQDPHWLRACTINTSVPGEYTEERYFWYTSKDTIEKPNTGAHLNMAKGSSW